VYQSAGRPGSVLAADVDRDGRLDLVVSNPDQGTGITSVFFSVLAPTISSFTPTSGPGGTTVTITGTNLQYASGVSFNGVAVAPGFVVNAAGTQITGVLVPAQAQTGPLTVTTPGGTVTAPTPFTVTVPAYDDCAGALPLTASGTCVPTLASVALATQSQAPTVCGSLTSTTARDAWFSFVATGLTPTVRATSVFNGVLEVFQGGSCGSLVSRSCANAVANAGVSGTETLTLTGLTTGTRYYVRYYPFTSASVPAPANGNFSICLTVPAPSITSFTPGTGTAGTVVTVFGLNLLTASSVTVGGVPVTGFTVNGAGNSLSFTLPAGAGSGPIVITTSGGTATSATSLVVASPQLALTQGATAYPNNGPTPYTFAARSTGTVSAPVTFALTNAGTQALSISGISTTGDFALSGPVPTTVAANGGTATVGVTFGPTADGARTGTLVITSGIGTYTVALAGTALAPPPTISSISPNPAAPGSTVTITGTNLAGFTSVQLGSTVLTGVTVSANGTTLTFVVPAGATAGSIQVTTPSGTVSSSTSLCVRYTPTTQGATACPGNTVTLTATGAAGNSYNWYATASSPTLLSTNTSGTFVTPALTATTTYYVAVSAGPGCEGPRQPVTATITPAPTVTVSAGGPTTFCQGGSVVLTASGASSYVWSNGTTTPSITVSTSGTYSVSGTNTAGCSATSAATAVTVNAPPTVTITPNGPTTFCEGGSVTLTASGADTYMWGTGQTTPSITVSTSGVYIVVGTTNGCSNNSSVVAVTVDPLPTAPTATPAARCGPGSVTLTASGAPAGGAYAWYTQATGGPTLSNSTATSFATPSLSATTTYYVSAVRATGCESLRTPVVATINAVPTVSISAGGPTTFCAGGNVVLTASGADSYLWSTGETTASITVAAAGSYSVTGTSAAGCPATSAATTVTVEALPTVSIAASGPTTFCQGGAVVLTASGGTSYLWSTGETTPSITVAASGSYTVAATNAAGCSATSAATAVTVEPLPATPVVTQTSPGTLSSSAASGNQWYFGGSLIPGATGPTYVVTAATGNGSYSVVTTSATGCASAASAAVTVIITGTTAATALPAAVELFPNPARSAFTLRLATGYAATGGTLYNALGQVVRTLPAFAGSRTVEVQALPSGVYTLRLTLAGQVLTKRVVVE
jgi:hypothetical protein